MYNLKVEQLTDKLILCLLYHGIYSNQVHRFQEALSGFWKQLIADNDMSMI